MGSQVSKQLEPPKKADAEYGFILGEVRQTLIGWPS